MWTIWDCIDEETREKLRKVARKPKNWNPSKPRQAITINGEGIEDSEELEKIAKQRPHHPKGEGYKPTGKQ